MSDNHEKHNLVKSDYIPVDTNLSLDFKFKLIIVHLNYFYILSFSSSKLYTST